MIGQAIGHYRITAKLGEGGMGVVYRATDTKLGREVAIKVLPEALSRDLERLARFEREARTLASLNHPNIAAVYGVEQGALVMELVEGPTLEERLKTGPVNADEAADIAGQIADALEAAHEKAVIHRDLKPANVKITPEGVVKLLDFGLAKALENETRAADPANSPTLTIGASVAGVIMGTAAYMSPEQARAAKVDRRSDIWAFGVVLNEMVTGRKLFQGDTISDTLAAVIRAEINLDSAPARFRTLLRRCLERDPKKRLGWIGEARTLMQETPPIEPVAVVAARARRRSWTPLPAGVAGLLAGYVLFPALRPELPDSSDLRLTPFATDAGVESQPRWSPDGRSIVYLKAIDGVSRVVVRALDNPVPLPLSPPTCAAVGPFWTPDGRTIYYRCSSAGLHSVPAVGGESREVIDRTSAADISPDGGTLALIKGPGLKLYLSSPPGSPPRLHPHEPVPGGSQSAYDYVRYSHDGRRILVRAEGTLAVLHADASASPARLIAGGVTSAWTLDDQGIVFPEKPGGGQTASLRLHSIRSGGSRRILSNLAAGFGDVDLSPDGERLAVAIGTENTDVVEISAADGEIRPLLASARSEKSARWLPGKSVIVYATNREGGDSIWIADLGRNSERRLVPSVTPMQIGLTVSPDGSRVAYLQGRRKILLASITGGTPIQIYESPPGEVHHRPDWSPDGRWLVFDSLKAGKRKLVKLRVDGGQSPEVITEGISAFHNRWSPDGKWIAVRREDKLAIVSPDGKSSRELTGLAGSSCVAWAPDSRSLYSIKVIEGRHQLSIVDIAPVNERVIRSFPPDVELKRDEICLDLSPDGKSLAATMQRATSDIWIIDGLELRRGWWDRLFARISKAGDAESKSPDEESPGNRR